MRPAPALAHTVAIRGGLGDRGGYVYAGCFAQNLFAFGGPAFPVYWDDATARKTNKPLRFVFTRKGCDKANAATAGVRHD